MSIPQTSCLNNKVRPANIRLWPYLLAFIVLVPLWIAALRIFIHPQALSPEQATMTSRLSYYMLPPAIFVIGMLSISCIATYAKQRKFDTHQTALIQEEARIKQQKDAQAKVLQDKQKFTLQIMGLGIAIQKFRQTKIWTEMEKSSGNKYIFPEDPAVYPKSSWDKFNVYEKREGDAFEHALSWFPVRTLIPIFMVTRSNHNPDNQDGLKVQSTQSSASVLISDFETIANIYNDDPDGILRQLFEYLDNHQEVPAVALFVKDSLVLRDYFLPEGAKEILKDGPWKKSDPDDAMVAFVFARKDRVDALRPYAVDPHANSNLLPFWEKSNAPTQPFRPTEWLPKPWTKEAIARFDSLPILGYLHRPQEVSYVKADGQMLGAKAREEAFEKAWKDALETLPEGQKPTRVFYDFGPASQAARLAPMNQSVHAALPDLDLEKDGYNLFPSLGDTGASSPFVGLALGVMASYKKNDISAAVCLRREDGASIYLVSPPTAEDRKKIHPGGPDPLNLKFKH